MKRLTKKRIFLLATALIIMVLGFFFVWLVYGMPLHDARLWILEHQFISARISHPDSSSLLERKSYLGGPSTHGDGVCIYAVGETRTAPLTETEIRQTYRNITVAGLPLKVFFADGHDWPYELPFVTWQDELMGMSPTNNTTYIVYIASTHHFLVDYRCDD